MKLDFLLILQIMILFFFQFSVLFFGKFDDIRMHNISNLLVLYRI